MQEIREKRAIGAVRISTETTGKQKHLVKRGLHTEGEECEADFRLSKLGILESWS
jgi:hypothetical protein